VVGVSLFCVSQVLVWALCVTIWDHSLAQAWGGTRRFRNCTLIDIQR
jgi:hypothetical protein